MRYLQCIPVGSESVVYTVPAINCNTQEYKNWQIIVILILILDICISPIIITLYLYRNHKYIIEKDSKLIARSGILFEGYNSKRYYTVSSVFRRI